MEEAGTDPGRRSPGLYPFGSQTKSTPLLQFIFNSPFQMSTTFGLVTFYHRKKKKKKQCGHTSRELMSIRYSSWWCWPRRQRCVLEKLARRPAVGVCVCAQQANPALAAAANSSLSIKKRTQNGEREKAGRV